MRLSLLLAALLATTAPAFSATIALKPVEITEWKAIYGRIEARDLVPARARIGGIVTELLASEGDEVKAGQRIATVHDDKLNFQIAALDAQLGGLQAQLAKSKAELERGETLLKRGLATAQRLDQLRTDVDVAGNQIAAVEAQRSIVQKQSEEGQVLAPSDGKVLTVSVTRGAVVLPGESIALLGGGGFFLRLAIPERHGSALKEGAAIRISSDGAERAGRLAKIYPLIENGRIIADVEVDDLDSVFVNARVLVQVPVGTRSALTVAASSIMTRSGIDFVKVMVGEEEIERIVIPGDRLQLDDTEMVEILSGLNAGDLLVTK